MARAGEVYWYERRRARGQEQRRRRPYVVVQTDTMSFLSTRLCVPTSTEAPEADWRVPLVVGGQETLALCEQVQVVTVQDLKSRLGHVTPTELDAIAAQVRELLWRGAEAPMRSA